MSNIYTLTVTGTYYLQVTAESEEEAWANRDNHVDSNIHEIMEYAEFEATDITDTGETE